MQLGKTQRTSQLMNSLKAEGEVILDEVQPIAVQSRTVLPPTDPITLTIEEKLNVIIRRDGGVSNFDVQGTLSVQILNQEDGLVQFQVCFFMLGLFCERLLKIKHNFKRNNWHYCKLGFKKLSFALLSFQTAIWLCC